MLLKPRELWEKGGYSKDNDFDVSMNFIRKHAKNKKFNGVDFILTEFFIELNSDPGKYYREDHSCTCKLNHGPQNSGTNAIHTITGRIDDEVSKINKTENEIFEDKLNKLIVAHMEDDNRQYLIDNSQDKEYHYYFEASAFIGFLILCFIVRYYGIR